MSVDVEGRGPAPRRDGRLGVVQPEVVEVDVAPAAAFSIHQPDHDLLAQVLPTGRRPRAPGPRDRLRTPGRPPGPCPSGRAPRASPRASRRRSGSWRTAWRPGTAPTSMSPWARRRRPRRCRPRIGPRAGCACRRDAAWTASPLIGCPRKASPSAVQSARVPVSKSQVERAALRVRRDRARQPGFNTRLIGRHPRRPWKNHQNNDHAGQQNSHHARSPLEMAGHDEPHPPPESGGLENHDDRQKCRPHPNGWTAGLHKSRIRRGRGWRKGGGRRTKGELERRLGPNGLPHVDRLGPSHKHAFGGVHHCDQINLW